MGYAQRENDAAGRPRVLEGRMAGARVVVDVQHVYRTGLHARDQGSVYTLPNGSHVAEAALSGTYAAALVAALRARSAAVLTNVPTRGVLVGPYERRNREANAFDAHAYLACHVNAGGGTYGAAEYMVGGGGQPLAQRIGLAVTATFPEVRGWKCVPLMDGQRGAVCIQAVDARRVALILEPFFGDCPAHVSMMGAAALQGLGEAIAAGLSEWWRQTHAAANG